MIFTKTELEGVYILEPRVFTDSRGYFFESYNEQEFQKNGLNYTFVQDNQSFSKYGTIRGLHFQKEYPLVQGLIRM
jgi:dTDP-4-dehydrorhamnose 3,5-epimerase